MEAPATDPVHPLAGGFKHPSAGTVHGERPDKQRAADRSFTQKPNGNGQNESGETPLEQRERQTPAADPLRIRRSESHETLRRPTGAAALQEATYPGEDHAHEHRNGHGVP